MVLYSFEDDDHSTYDPEEASLSWEDFKLNIMCELFANFIYPIQLEAQNSNWRGQTGYSEVEDFDELMKKICSFNSSFIELHKEDDEYYFKLATHDVPTGFCVYITKKEEDES